MWSQKKKKKSKPGASLQLQRKGIQALPYSVAMQHKLYCTTWKYVEIELSQQALTIKKKKKKTTNIPHN